MGPNWSCLRSISEQTYFLFLLKQWASIPCLVWSRVLARVIPFFLSGSLDIIVLHWESATTSIIRDDTLIDNVVFCKSMIYVRTLIFKTNAILSPKYVIQVILFS